MKTILAGFAVVFALAGSAAAQGLTLREAVEEALSKNPAIAGSDAQQRAAVARQAEARAARFPRIEASESVTRGNNPVFVFGSLLEQGRFAPRHFDPAFLNAPPALTNDRASVTARFAIFDRFRTTTAVRQSGNAAGRASLELEEARQRMRADVIARYYGVIVAGEKVVVAKDAVRAAEADAKAARDRFEQGLLVESDALSADVQVATLRQRLIAGEGEQAIARAALATLLQRPRRDDIPIGGAIPSVPSDEPDLDAAIAHAVSSRAPVRTAALVTSDAQLRLAAERGAALPRVDAFATAGASGSSTFGRRNSDYTGAVVVTIDLFDRARPARVAAARAEIDVARAGDSMARDAVTMEVIAAWQRLRTARESALVAAAAVEQAQAAARIVRDRYEHGLTTITEQLRAQTALVSARFELLAARYESVVAHAELLRATGDLNDVQPFI